jgi:hypothetical protein
MLKLRVNPLMQPGATVAVASPKTLASHQSMRPVFYDAARRRRIAVQIASALLTIALTILLAAFVVSVRTGPRLLDNPLPKATLARTLDVAVVQADLLPAHRTTVGHMTARAPMTQVQPAPATQAQATRSAPVTGGISTMP